MTTVVPAALESRSISLPGGHPRTQSLRRAFIGEPERDVDGGRVPHEILEGRLPPAYGDQIN